MQTNYKISKSRFPLLPNGCLYEYSFKDKIEPMSVDIYDPNLVKRIQTPLKWVDNVPFKRDFLIDSISSYRTVHIKLKCPKTLEDMGIMKLTDFFEMTRKGIIHHGDVSGTWAYRKSSGYNGIIYLGK